MLQLYGREIDPGADYQIFFSGKQPNLDPVVRRRFTETMKLAMSVPPAAAASIISKIPLDEFPHVIVLTGLVLVDFVMDHEFVPLFDAGFAHGVRKITVMTLDGYTSLIDYRKRLRDASGKR